MLKNKHTFWVITGAVLCLLLVIISALAIGNTFGSASQSISSAGTRTAGSASGTAYISSPTSSLSADPAAVAEAYNFSQTFTLTLDLGSFINGINTGDITLGENFSGLTINTVSRISSESINVTIKGTLSKNMGTGSITVLPTGTDIGSSVTANIAVNSASSSADDLVSLSINEGFDGTGAELIDNFTASNYNYTVQAAENVETIKVTAMAAPGTNFKIIMDGGEKADGIIQLSKGTNTIKVVVSELSKADKTYNIVVYK